MSVAFVPNVGTLVIGQALDFWDPEYRCDVYIVTQNSDWDLVTNSTNQLSRTIKGQRYLGVTTKKTGNFLI